MKKATKRKLKKIFNLYNFAILACVVIIIVSLIVLLKPDFSSIFKRNEEKGTSTEQQDQSSSDKKDSNSNSNVEIVKSDNNGNELSEKDARKLAKKQFKKLDEKVKEDDLKVTTIKRSGEEYYYIASQKNTVEIAKKTGKITRINAVSVNE